MAGGLNGQAGEQGAEPESAGWGDRTYDDAYSLMLSGSLLHDSRGECAGGSAGGHALQDPGGYHPADVRGHREHHHRDQLQRQRAEHHRAPADIVRQRSRHQQCREQSERVDGERDGEHPGRETPALLEQAQDRRRCASGDIQRGESRAVAVNATWGGRVHRRERGGATAAAGMVSPCAVDATTVVQAASESRATCSAQTGTATAAAPRVRAPECPGTPWS
jgi:hypothetical protein